MSLQWTLVARINDGGPALKVEAVRSLSAPELSSLDEAQRILTSLTSGSPYQAAADAYAAAIEAFEGLRAEATESGAARQERAWRALELALAAMTAAPAKLSQLAAEVTGAATEVAAVASAAERLQARAEWQMLHDAVANEAAPLVWADTPAGPEVLLESNDGSRLRIQPLLNAVMQGLAVITAEVFVATADSIGAASRVVRALEAEVLFGRAALAVLPVGEIGEPNGNLRLRDLPVDLVAAAQGTLRRARALLVAADHTSGHHAEGSAQNAEGLTRESPVAPGQTDPAADASDEAADTANVVHPPVDLYRVAQHLAETLTAVEKAYGQVPPIEEIFNAAEHDIGAYGSFLRQVGIALQRTEEALAAAGVQPVRVNLPPTSSDIDALTLDGPSPQMRLRQQFTAELLVVEGAAEQLQSLRNPSEMRLGPGGVVLSARFDPAAPGRVRGWMLQAARMAEHSAEVAAAATGADTHADSSTEENWLARAAGICLDYGLHEAALLYLAASASASASRMGEAEESPDGIPRKLAAETLLRFAAGDTRNASAVAISLVRAMWRPIAATTQAASHPAAQAAPGPAPSSGETDSPASAQ